MFKLLSTLVFTATAVHAIAIPRATAPDSYNTDLLEVCGRFFSILFKALLKNFPM